MAKRAVVPKVNALAFPNELVGKQALEAAMRAALHEQLKERPAPHLYLLLKQIEHAVGMALDELKPLVVTEVQAVLPDGQNAVTLGGHILSLKTRTEWNYGPEVTALQAEQKKTLDAEKAIAKAEGRATKTVLGTTVAVELAP